MSSDFHFKKVSLESDKEKQDLVTHANPDCVNCGPTDSKMSHDSKSQDLVSHANVDCVNCASDGLERDN